MGSENVCRIGWRHLAFRQRKQERVLHDRCIEVLCGTHIDSARGGPDLRYAATEPNQARTRLTKAPSAEHRVFSGVTGAMFLRDVRLHLEELVGSALET